MMPRYDGNSPSVEYLDLLRDLDKANSDFFATEMKKCSADVAVKLPDVVDGVVQSSGYSSEAAA